MDVKIWFLYNTTLLRVRISSYKLVANFRIHLAACLHTTHTAPLPESCKYPTTYSKYRNSIQTPLIKNLITIQNVKRNMSTKTLEEKFETLPPDLQKEAADFIDFLLTRKTPRKKKKPTLNWMGSLKEYRSQYTSLELQKKSPWMERLMYLIESFSVTCLSIKDIICVVRNFNYPWFHTF